MIKIKLLLLLSALCLNTACQTPELPPEDEDIIAIATDKVERDWLVIADIYRKLDDREAKVEKKFLLRRMKQEEVDPETRLRLGMLMSLHGRTLKELSSAHSLLKETVNTEEMPVSVKRIASLLMAQSQQTIRLRKQLLESEKRSKELVQKLQAVSSIEQKLEERTRE